MARLTKVANALADIGRLNQSGFPKRRVMVGIITKPSAGLNWYVCSFSHQRNPAR
jgi:hypothetical protein